jgi:hypothetical protein
MGIVFFCQSCGARFEVAPQLAGKKGRCKKCSQFMTVPRAEQLASMSAMPALVLSGAVARTGGNARPATGTGEMSIGSLIKAGISQVGLVALSAERMPVRPFLASALADGEDSKPYAMAQPLVRQRGRVTAHDNALVRVWRRQLGKIQKLFRMISQVAYVVSLPFLMILIVGTALQNRPIALFGATFLVLVNIARLVAGGINLAVVPFRDVVDVGKMKKPLRRVIEPIVTIGLVIVAFTFIPWLSEDAGVKGSVTDRLRSSAEELKNEMKGKVNRVVDVDKLGNIAQQELKLLGDEAQKLDVKKLSGQAREQLKNFGGPAASDDGAGPPP